FLQERPYATAYWPFSVMESCTSNANPPTFSQTISTEMLTIFHPITKRFQYNTARKFPFF
ncbi:hypothetical protein, partial [Neisseria mucosa]|uniref:hypothetical protein n=1 Tax=Neisseria mucosa TaxID=488 RepID=UPI00280AF1D4